MLWLSFAFLINKAPNYTRLLITLPFVAYFVAVATRFLAGKGAAACRRVATRVGRSGTDGLRGRDHCRLSPPWNLAIAWDFIQEGRKNGEPIGDRPLHRVSSRRPGRRSIWPRTTGTTGTTGSATATATGLRLFAHEGQVGANIPPTSLNGFSATPPFAIFMTLVSLDDGPGGT